MKDALSDAADEIQKAIDMEILHEVSKPLMIDKGWHCVTLKQTHWKDIPLPWVDENIHHPYNCLGFYWYFESQSDATAFALRWL